MLAQQNAQLQEQVRKADKQVKEAKEVKESAMQSGLSAMSKEAQQYTQEMFATVKDELLEDVEAHHLAVGGRLAVITSEVATL